MKYNINIKQGHVELGIDNRSPVEPDDMELTLVVRTSYTKADGEEVVTDHYIALDGLGVDALASAIEVVKSRRDGE